MKPGGGAHLDSSQRALLPVEVKTELEGTLHSSEWLTVCMYVLKYLQTDVSKILTGAFVGWFRNLDADAGPEPNIKSEFSQKQLQNSFPSPINTAVSRR